MQNTTQLLIALLTCLALTACSWSQHFAIVNTTQDTLTITYTFQQPPLQQYIFVENPIAYSIKEDYQPNWSSPNPLTDEDSTTLTVQVKLPPSQVLVFGTLRNDEYEGADHRPINGQLFNLQTLRIERGETVEHISAQTFDSYFMKRKDYIRYVIE
ncbi:MAG: hypothetical protein ACFB0B_09540 [Thermonemataceae bacterium]|mgnify:CR=1 FL=1